MNLRGSYVLDSFALLSYLENEAGADLVRKVLEYGSTHAGRVFLSVINFGEIIYIIEREQGLVSAHKAIAVIDQLPVEVVPADRGRTLAASHIKAQYRVSFADAFAIALAQQEDATVVTGDPEFREVERQIAILWLPQAKAQ